MGWYDSDLALTEELRQRGFDVDEDTVAAARLDAGKDFSSPLGDEDLREIIQRLGAKKAKQERTASPGEVAEFRQKLASPEWRHLLEALQMLVGLLPGDIPANLARIGECVDDVKHLVLRNHDAAFGNLLPSMVDDAVPNGVVQLIELRRQAALLASYLGTSSIRPLLAALIYGDSPEPEALQPASPGRAIDDFHAVLFRLLGLSWPGSTIKMREVRDLLLVGHVQRPRGRPSRDWDEARISWNRQYPDWAYDSTEAFRKACDRAGPSRPDHDSS